MMEENMMGGLMPPQPQQMPEQMPPQMPTQMPQMPQQMGALMPEEKIDTTSDALYEARELKIKDRNLAKKILELNLKEFNKKKKDIYFEEKEKIDFIKEVDYAIKAIMQHEITKRVGK